MSDYSPAVVRPARLTDLPGLFALAGKAGVGLTTLPQNEALLAERLQESERAFARDQKQLSSENYLFVLESEGRVVACSAVISAVGTEQAFYNYHVGRSVFASRELGVYQAIPTLYLSNDLTGASELATLFVDPDFRSSGAGRLISLCRFLFIAAHRQRFSERVIAELRGYADEQGRSPFWESLGRHFFSMDFSQADQLSGAATRAFIAELMPKHPVYTAMLTEAAQQTIGQVHPDTRGARRILEKEGFRYRDYVDIFDAGPVLEAETGQIAAIRKSTCRRVTTSPFNTSDVAQQDAVVGNEKLSDFRALRAEVQCSDKLIYLQQQQCADLQVQEGDFVRIRTVK